jgi:hypothetical protein
MKTKTIIFMALLTLTSIIAAVLPDTGNKCTYRVGSGSESITPEEEQALIYMREEEKLAHDVYTFMLDKYDYKIFRNISKAETRHGDFIKELLDRYSVADPSSGKSAGEFTNTGLADMYSRLIEKGCISVNEALKCGAEIEELDIADLDTRIDIAASPDIKNTFQNLRDGSERHLQAFIRNLKAAGVTYSPVHLSQSRFDNILNNDVTKDYRCGDCPNYKNCTGNFGKNGCDGTGPKGKGRK